MNSDTVVIPYWDNLQIGGLIKSKAKVGKISGNEITFGPLFVFSGHPGRYYTRGFAMDSTRFVVTYNATRLNAIVGEISGTDITFGTEVIIDNSSGVHPDSIKLDSTHFFVVGSRASTKGIGWVCTVSGRDITVGSPSEFSPSRCDNMSLAALDSSTVACAYYRFAPNAGYKLQIAKIVGTTITWGPFFSSTTSMTIFTIDSSRFIGSYDNTGTFKCELFVVNGVDVTTTGTTTLIPGKTCVPSKSAMSFGKFVIPYSNTTDSNAGVIAGYVNRIATLTSPSTPAPPYLTCVNATRVTLSMWAKNPTKGLATVTVRRGYEVTLSESSITLGTATATWATGVSSLMSTMNDGNSHLLLLDFANSGGSNWQMRWSIDGGAWSTPATQDSGSQALAATDSAPRINLSDPENNGQWVDEVALWANADLFTVSELQNMYDLSQVFGDPLDQYESNFGAPLCWQATAKLLDGSIWRESGSGSCPTALRVPPGAFDLIVTDDGKPVAPVIREG